MIVNRAGMSNSTVKRVFSSLIAIINRNVINRINLDISNPRFIHSGFARLSQQELIIIQNFSELFC